MKDVTLVGIIHWPKVSEHSLYGIKEYLQGKRRVPKMFLKDNYYTALTQYS